jgi:TorA maturation chaperone TorD
MSLANRTNLADMATMVLLLSAWFYYPPQSPALTPMQEALLGDALAAQLIEQ